MTQDNRPRIDEDSARQACYVHIPARGSLSLLDIGAKANASTSGVVCRRSSGDRVGLAYAFHVVLKCEKASLRIAHRSSGLHGTGDALVRQGEQQGRQGVPLISSTRLAEFCTDAVHAHMLVHCLD
jgi:hypothetical protein